MLSCLWFYLFYFVVDERVAVLLQWLRPAYDSSQYQQQPDGNLLGQLPRDGVHDGGACIDGKLVGSNQHDYQWRLVGLVGFRNVKQYLRGREWRVSSDGRPQDAFENLLESGATKRRLRLSGKRGRVSAVVGSVQCSGSGGKKTLDQRGVDGRSEWNSAVLDAQRDLSTGLKRLHGDIYQWKHEGIKNQQFFMCSCFIVGVRE